MTVPEKGKANIFADRNHRSQKGKSTMKKTMKRCLSIIFAALLTVSALTGCASFESLPPEPAGEDSGHGVSSNQAARPIISSSAAAAYEKLTAYKTGNYSQQSIADFNTALAATPEELTEFLAAQADVISAISPDDENYDFFTTTMTFSAQELYCEHMGEEVAFSFGISKESRPCDYADEEGNPVYEFYCSVDLQVPYVINSPKLVSVAERDQTFLTFKEEMQNYLNGLSEAEITDSDIKKMLLDKSAELENSLSTENMKLLPCEIYLIEISDAGVSVTREIRDTENQR